MEHIFSVFTNTNNLPAISGLLLDDVVTVVFVPWMTSLDLKHKKVLTKQNWSASSCDRPIGLVVKGIAMGAVPLGFN